ncbi:MAG: sulfite exporter TauE/SafE family protein [Caldilineaceae bacterium]
MIAAFLLGLTGSLGHCVGMCSGVSLLLSRKANVTRWRLLLLHGGRITTYALLGSVAGSLGFVLGIPGGHARHMQPQSAGWPAMSTIQGLLALLTALVALYLAIALVGRAPSPELYLSRLTQWWGRVMRQVPTPAAGLARNRISLNNPISALLTVYSLGLLWGLLPCGLVLAALLAATSSTSPGGGALIMAAFGLGTWPVGLSVGLAARWPRWTFRPTPSLRSAAALVILTFGLQMALRGLAAWGVVNHLHLGGFMVW